jgi:hypothetical protein
VGETMLEIMLSISDQRSPILAFPLRGGRKIVDKIKGTERAIKYRSSLQ